MPTPTSASADGTQQSGNLLLCVSVALWQQRHWPRRHWEKSWPRISQSSKAATKNLTTKTRRFTRARTWCILSSSCLCVFAVKTGCRALPGMIFASLRCFWLRLWDGINSNTEYCPATSTKASGLKGPAPENSAAKRTRHRLPLVDEFGIVIAKRERLVAPSRRRASCRRVAEVPVRRTQGPGIEFEVHVSRVTQQ